VRHEAPNAAELDDAVMNMRVIEAVLASGKSGRVEPL